MESLISQADVRDCTTIEEMKAEIERLSSIDYFVRTIFYDGAVRRLSMQDKLITLSYFLLKKNNDLKKQLGQKYLKEPIRITGVSAGMMIVDDPIKCPETNWGSNSPAKLIP